jgi:hypothetical protein
VRERARVVGNAVLDEVENAHALYAVQDGTPTPCVRVHAHSVREGLPRAGRRFPPILGGTRTLFPGDRETQKGGAMSCAIPPRGLTPPPPGPHRGGGGRGSGFQVLPLFPEAVTALLTHPVFQEMGGAKRGQPPPLNRLTTATAPSSPNGQPKPATPVQDGDFAPLYRPRNRPSTAPPTGSTSLFTNV